MHSQSSHSIAAPGGAQDAPRPSATIQAPVTPRRGAAIERGDDNQIAGVGAPGAGIAGMAGSASAARPQDVLGSASLTCLSNQPPVRTSLMVKRKDLLWEAAPHTLAKHEILNRYLEAWFPILARHKPRLVYFDGFAGPGRYRDGQEGSPLLALRAARAHFARLRDHELLFVFVEQDAKAAAWLQAEINQLKLPEKLFRVRVVNGECEDALRKLLDWLDTKNWHDVPTFALLDPFGLKGLPFALVERLLRRRSCEVLVTFMTHSAQRWHGVLPDYINSLIGDPLASEKIGQSPNKADAAKALYQTSLASVVRFVRYFRMRNRGGNPIYDLFFATENPLGFLKMKEAMWALDRSGTFRFSDASNPDQTTLFAPTPELDLAPVLAQRFAGQRVIYEEVERFVVEETTYLPSHAKKALQALEGDPQQRMSPLRVEPIKRDGTKRRGHYFANGTFMTFAAPREQAS